MIERQATTADSPERMKEELIVEVGCGVRPLLEDFTSEYLAVFKNDPNLRIVAIDIDEEDIREAKSFFDDVVSEKFGPEASARVSFIRASGDMLPFRDGSVSEITFTSTLGDPRIGIDVRENMIREAKRVLKIGGTLKIVELITPAVAPREGLLALAESVFGGSADLNLDGYEDVLKDRPELDKGLDAKLFSARTKAKGSFIARLRKS